VRSPASAALHGAVDGRSTAGFTQMGGEGASWVGEAPFVKTPHVFQTHRRRHLLSLGTAGSAGSAASGVNVTYKILYNDAVAMTGGQPVDGPLTVPQITLQVYSEGAKKIAVVTDEPEKYPRPSSGAPGVTIHHRDDYDQVQRQFRDVPGLSVHHLRPDLRGGKAPPAQAQSIPGSRQARVSSTTWCAKAAATAGEIQTACRCCRWRPSSAASRTIDQVVLQQGLFLRQRLLPELRHRARRRRAQKARVRLPGRKYRIKNRNEKRKRCSPPFPNRVCRRWISLTASW